ncbi:AMP-binding protein [Tomitella fengzijianii]|uniref:AMP-binding protein n=1 Tax=Tomitella fengzijianii TaxID=2597660 RepID=A0A516X547_9ACTN|nr:AMP-binding protein [Tomitella fengzijianii]QDQ97781.1 AMP-binding protein [Tomitella fengzijianii]
MIIGGRSVANSVNRVLATAQNGLEVLRLGGLEMEPEKSPFEVVDRRPMYRLRRYFPESVHAVDGVSDRPPILLIPPMMLDAEVYDVTRDKGGAGVLHDHGVDPWVIDFGSPDTEAGGLGRNLADHIVAVSQAVDTIRERTGRDVHLAGYSQGGMFAYQAAAYRQSAGLAGVITFGSPVDTLAGLPFGLPVGLATRGADLLADHVLSHLYLPAWGARLGFQLLDPVKTAKSRLDFVRQLHDRDALLPREAQRRFLENDGFVAYAGPAIAELLKQFIAHNRMMTGGFVIDGRLVSLAEITCPVLAFVGDVDDIGQPVAVQGIVKAAPKADVYEHRLPSGHFGLVVGSTAAEQTWPGTASWILWQEAGAQNGTAELSDRIHRMAPDEGEPGDTGVTVTSRLSHGVNTLTEAGIGATKSIIGLTLGVTRSAVAIAEEAARTLPRLARLGEMQSHTRISFGRLLAEQAQAAPDGECFLFEDRVHTNKAVDERIDNVVRGLIHVGVRQGAEVGVLMETRPSALVAIAALSRLGAVAVLLPMGEGLRPAMELTSVSTVLADPESIEEAAEAGCRVLVLGGGDARELDLRGRHQVVDMEKIDPTTVRLPKWYRPDPGQARDLAFIMFAESGGQVEARRISNRRWALSAFGTASAAALGNGDTVYCLTPLNHPSGLLTSVGGAVAGGARIALTGRFDPARFVEEVPRYGVTVVAYTWTQMRDLVGESAPALGAHHPIRMFIGSGMPAGLWESVTEVFAPAQVVEFYASTEGGAVLANLSQKKPGAKGRPLPGSAPVRLAAFDVESGTYLEDEDGLVRQAGEGEVGRLLSKVLPDMDVPATVLRGVFESGDAWVPSHDLFYLDSDGDFWMIDTVEGVVHGVDGPVYRMPVADALGRLPEVTGAVAYGVDAGGAQVAVAAVTVRAGDVVQASDLDEAVSVLPAGNRPAVVRVVESIPRTAWYRPIGSGFAAEGLPAEGSGVFGYDRDSGHYAVLTPELRSSLIAVP